MKNIDSKTTKTFNLRADYSDASNRIWKKSAYITCILILVVVSFVEIIVFCYWMKFAENTQRNTFYINLQVTDMNRTIKSNNTALDHYIIEKTKWARRNWNISEQLHHRIQSFFKSNMNTIKINDISCDRSTCYTHAIYERENQLSSFVKHLRHTIHYTKVTFNNIKNKGRYFDAEFNLFFTTKRSSPARETAVYPP